MKERPILFSGPMVRAILDGRKTQTRRVIKPQPYCPTPEGDYYPDPYAKTHYWCFWGKRGTDAHNKCSVPLFRCPYGQPGDRLWVRETWATDSQVDNVMPRDLSKGEPIYYAASNVWRTTGCQPILRGKLRPSIFMMPWMSRILLQVTNVRVERLQDISEADVISEGVRDLGNGFGEFNHARGMQRAVFHHAWEQINGPESWDANPWVWVIEFKRVGE